jgi:hypothetical protein
VCWQDIGQGPASNKQSLWTAVGQKGSSTADSSADGCKLVPQRRCPSPGWACCHCDVLLATQSSLHSQTAARSRGKIDATASATSTCNVFCYSIQYVPLLCMMPSWQDSTTALRQLRSQTLLIALILADLPAIQQHNTGVSVPSTQKGICLSDGLVAVVGAPAAYEAPAVLSLLVLIPAGPKSHPLCRHARQHQLLECLWLCSTRLQHVFAKYTR